ncbi:hypothetical protein ACWGI9_45240 [Streptomyces sp. NPDC054833]
MIARYVVNEGHDSTPPRKISDWDLAKLVRRGMKELAEDPAASEVHRRITDRQEELEDRRHRELSDKSAILGCFVGLAFLIAFAVGVFITIRNS